VSMVPVRTLAYQKLVAALEAACPELTGRVSVEAHRDERMAWPKLGILVTSAPFRMSERRIHTALTGETVYDVGHFEPRVQLRLGAPTHRQRVDLGEKLLGAFMDPSRPGILVTTVPEVYSATCAWELDGEDWQDEFAFENKRWSVMTCTGFIPALVRTPTVEISDLRLAFAESMPTVPVETLRINLDGSLTKL
jgi:hypothetical protein